MGMAYFPESSFIFIKALTFFNQVIPVVPGIADSGHKVSYFPAESYKIFFVFRSFV